MKYLIISFICLLIGFSISYINTPSYDPTIRSITTTSNATPATLFSMALATGQTVRITVDVLAKSGNNRLRGIKTATIKNISGTLTVIGATVSDIATIVSDAGLVTAGWTITTSGTNVIIQVTGIAATSIDWISNSYFIMD